MCREYYDYLQELHIDMEDDFLDRVRSQHEGHSVHVGMPVAGVEDLVFAPVGTLVTIQKISPGAPGGAVFTARKQDPTFWDGPGLGINQYTKSFMTSELMNLIRSEKVISAIITHIPVED